MTYSRGGHRDPKYARWPRQSCHPGWLPWWSLRPRVAVETISRSNGKISLLTDLAKCGDLEQIETSAHCGMSAMILASGRSDCIHNKLDGLTGFFSSLAGALLVMELMLIGRDGEGGRTKARVVLLRWREVVDGAIG